MHTQSFIQTNHGISFPFVGPKLQRQGDLENEESQGPDRHEREEKMNTASAERHAARTPIRQTER